eukprot:12550395-Heterocapsa_arctica.AAC.1
MVQGGPKASSTNDDKRENCCKLEFVGERADYDNTGEYWIVQRLSAKIQGRYMPLPIANSLA